MNRQAQTRRRTVAGAVLAAGAGTRFSGLGHKLLADFRGQPLVSWAIDAADRAGFDHLYVATGSVDIGHLIPESATEVTVSDWEEGQSRSLQAIVVRARADGHGSLVVGLGDQPLVPTSAWRSVGASSGEIVIATFGGVRRPPVRLGESLWPELPTEGDLGARVVIRLRPDLVSEVPCMGNPQDIDTAEDLLRWN